MYALVYMNMQQYTAVFISKYSNIDGKHQSVLCEDGPASNDNWVRDMPESIALQTVTFTLLHSMHTYGWRLLCVGNIPTMSPWR